MMSVRAAVNARANAPALRDRAESVRQFYLFSPIFLFASATSRVLPGASTRVVSEVRSVRHPVGDEFPPVA